MNNVELTTNTATQLRIHAARTFEQMVLMASTPRQINFHVLCDIVGGRVIVKRAIQIAKTLACDIGIDFRPAANIRNQSKIKIGIHFPRRHVAYLPSALT
jgi:hypothetical protein